MSTISAASLADACQIAWNLRQTLNRKAHMPANVDGLYEEAVARLVALQGGTANTTNVKAAIVGGATGADAQVTIEAL